MKKKALSPAQSYCECWSKRIADGETTIHVPTGRYACSVMTVRAFAKRNGYRVVHVAAGEHEIIVPNRSQS